MALDDRMTARAERWQVVFVERPERAEGEPEFLAALYLRLGKDGAMELYSGFPVSKADNRPLFSFWYLKTFERAAAVAQRRTEADAKAAKEAQRRAAAEAHRLTIAAAKAVATPDPRW